MKRFVFWFLVAIAAVLWVKSRSPEPGPPPPAPIVVVHPIDGTGGADGKTLYKINGEGRRVYRLDAIYRMHPGAVIKVVDDRPALLVNVDDEGVNQDDNLVLDDQTFRPLEPAEGLPVPVVPGSRVSTARIEPPAPPEPPSPPKASRHSKRPKPRKPSVALMAPSEAPVKVVGRLSATEERARKDARIQLERKLADRLAPEVPRTWKPPASLVDSTIRRIDVRGIERDYGTVYEATLTADLSTRKKAEFVAVYHREQVLKRLAVLGGVLAFVLVCLAAVAGYVRADEATKGYYTSRLQLAAAAGVGASGVALYRLLG